MWRYVSVSIVFGLLVSTGVFVLYEMGVFTKLAEALWTFYYSSNLFPVEREARGPIDLLQIAVFTALGLGIAWCVIDIPRAHYNALVAVCALFLVMGFSFTLALYGVFFEPFSGALAIVGSYVLGSLYARTRQGRGKRLLLAILGERISQEGLFKLLGSSSDLPTPRTRAVTVLTCRVFNYAQLARELEPNEMVEMSNLFLKNAIEHGLGKGGYVDDAQPDCVRVLYGIDREENHAEQGCRAAIEMEKRLVNLNGECERRWFRQLRCGIGVSTGPVTTGVFGSERDAFFSGVGSEIAFSRRLCALNLKYGSTVLVGARSYLETKEKFEVRPIDMIYMEEDEVLTEVYELLEEQGNLTEEEEKSRDTFWQGMIYFREGKRDEALESFSRASIKDREDAPLEYYLKRTRDELSESRGPGGSEGERRSKDMIRL